MSQQTIAERISDFAVASTFGDIPGSVRSYAKHLMLDGTGTALAAIPTDFAASALQAARSFGQGDSVAFALDARLPLRDAVLVNGVLIHGLDFDDTHLEGVVHATSSCLPTALAVAAALDKSGEDMLLAYVLGMEVAARIGAVAKGELNQIGFHPTGVAAAFGCSVAAGKLYGLSAEQMTMAQGIALSMASGTREYSVDGSWTKRLHPGWAGVCGITAANLAHNGFTGPRTAYEGRFGLFSTHLADRKHYDLAAASRALGDVWETGMVAIKPLPSCQLNIACIDAALALHSDPRLKLGEIVEIEAVIPRHAVAIVCEPKEAKQAPGSPYAAQFSLYFGVACALMRGTFGLAELEMYRDEAIISLARKVRYRVDENTNYPVHFSGEVIVTLKSGEVLRHHEAINRGARERPISAAEIVEKYRANAGLGVCSDQSEAIAKNILNIEAFGARDLSRVLEPAG
jgi:2-methylcitrate dehydratase PrpD